MIKDEILRFLLPLKYQEPIQLTTRSGESHDLREKPLAESVEYLAHLLQVQRLLIGRESRTNLHQEFATLNAHLLVGKLDAIHKGLLADQLFYLCVEVGGPER